MAKRPITPSERVQWSALGHLVVLQGLSDATDWTSKDFAFHGGTSLHLSWNSPRFSEDLDFLLARNKQGRLKTVMAATLTRVKQALALADPEMNVEIKDKSTERMGHYQFVLSKKDVLGSVMLKTEFWHVEPRYLESYKNSPRTPSVPIDLGGKRLRIDCMLPAATLQSALCDKLTAFSTRPHLKWRDIFDFWWIQQQTLFEPMEPPELAQRMLHHLSAYNTVDGLSPGDALGRYAKLMEDPAVIETAQRDLKPFVPKKLWDSFWPDTIREMVLFARDGALKAAVAVERYGPQSVAQDAGAQPDQPDQSDAAIQPGEDASFLELEQEPRERGA